MAIHVGHMQINQDGIEAGFLDRLQTYNTIGNNHAGMA
jgi:hypothetical protein